MERLTHQDDSLLRIEDEVSAVHGMTVGVFEGPQPAFDDIQDLVESRLPYAPRYRQRLIEMPLGLERPTWVDDPHFKTGFHVRNTALPERRDVDALSALVSRLQSQRLDRSKPLWELWVVSNLRDDHWALISKVHYAMIDGVSGTDLFGLLLDEVPTPDLADEYQPGPLPSRLRLLPDAVIDRLFDPVETWQHAAKFVTSPWRKLRNGLESMRPDDPESLRTEIGPHRRWHRVQVPLDDFRKARATHGCSTNDVILAAIVGGIRHYLLEHGQHVPSQLNAMIPLAIASADTGFSQEVAPTLASLPIGIDDPLARLDAITARTALTARTKGAVAGDAFRRQDSFSTPTIMALTLRAALQKLHDSHRVDVLAVNVPGPARTEHVMGRQLLKAYPVIPLAGRVPLAFAVMSYCQDVSFGITGDYDSTPDIQIIAQGIRTAVNELLD